jgi:hypothetical protein
MKEGFCYEFFRLHLQEDLKNMQTVATVSSRMIRQPRVTAYRAVPGPLARFRRFIETTDWDGRYLRHRRTDQVCRGILIATALYFIPVLAHVLLR